MTTLKDVAQRAGVSAMTVSNVVNGRSGKVSQATIERVRAAIAELGYVPNAQARALASASSHIIALVYGLADNRPPLSISHESVFVGACEQACREAGYVVMLCACGHEPAQMILARLQGWNVAGVIVMGTTPPSVRQVLDQLGVPIVAIDSRSGRMAGVSIAQVRRIGGVRGTDALGDIDAGEMTGPWSPPGALTVGIDDAGGGALAGAHLAAHGHTRIVVAAPYPHHSRIDIDRINGLRSGLGENAEIRLCQVPVDYAAAADTGVQLAVQMRREKQTAVFASADLIGMGIVAGLRREGVRVPEDVSVVGFDGFDMSTYCDPVLTTVVQPVQDKAREAVRLVRGGTEDVVLPVSWRVGGTLGPAQTA